MDPKFGQRGVKRKRSDTLIPPKLSPIERRIREDEQRSKRQNSGQLYTVYVFPLSFLKPIKSDKIRSRLTDLTVSSKYHIIFANFSTGNKQCQDLLPTSNRSMGIGTRYLVSTQVNAGDPKLVTGLATSNDQAARALKITTHDLETGTTVAKLALQLPEWGSCLEPIDPRTRMLIHVSRECPDHMLKDRESTRQLLTYLLGGLIEVDDLKVTRPPFWNRKGKQTIIFILGKEDAIQALRKRKEQRGGPFIAH